MKYLVQSPTEIEVGPRSSVRNTFEEMMVAKDVVRLDPGGNRGDLVQEERTSYTTTCVHGYIKKRKLGWSSDVVDSSGKAFINVLADVFRCIDRHHGSLDGFTLNKTKDCEMSLSLGACL